MLWSNRKDHAVEFDTAVARVQAEDSEEEVSYSFTINEVDEKGNVVNSVECHAYAPEDGNIMMLMADLVSRRAGIAQQIAGLVDFITDVLDEESRDYIVRRLMDRTDPFGITDLRGIVDYLMEEWSGRPTKQPSDYLPSRKVGGQKSTPRTRKSTSSVSRRTAS